MLPQKERRSGLWEIRCNQNIIRAFIWQMLQYQAQEDCSSYRLWMLWPQSPAVLVVGGSLLYGGKSRLSQWHEMNLYLPSVWRDQHMLFDWVWHCSALVQKGDQSKSLYYCYRSTVTLQQCLALTTINSDQIKARNPIKFHQTIHTICHVEYPL